MNRWLWPTEALGVPCEMYKYPTMTREEQYLNVREM